MTAATLPGPPRPPVPAWPAPAWPGRWLALVLIALASGLGAVRAATVTIDTGADPEARLEVRTVTLPSGETVAFYVVSADRVTVVREDVTIIASRLEFDPDAGRVRIIGRGRVERPDEVLVGDDLIVDLDDGRLEGRDVWVIVDRLNVYGVRAERIDGRIRLLDGDVAPCGRCGQTTEDYGFLAERIEILPGDRLIAWDVVVLLRERPFLPLPLLVLPLADPTRTPRLALERGSDRAPASLDVDWPYVAGATAYGTLRARLVLDVDPDSAGPLDGRILGGRVETVYPQGGLDHRFFDAKGAGSVEIDVRPPYDDEERSTPWVRFEARYASDERIGEPGIDLRVARDDEARADLLELEARVQAGALLNGDETQVRVALSHRSAVPLADDAATRPSWDGPGQPLAEPFRLRGETLGRPLTFGPVSLTAASVDVGVVADQPNPVNRSAIGRGDDATARLEVRHRLELAPSSLGPFEIDGVNDFLGRYYATEERQIDWLARARLRLPIGDAGSLSLSGSRDAAEGETPFAFDRLQLRTRSELTASLDLRPWTGVRLTGDAGYVLEDDRAADEIGWTPTRLRLDAFTTTAWLDAALVHRADPARSDLGTLALEAGVRLPDPDRIARVEASATVDLEPGLAPDRQDLAARDTGEGAGQLRAGWRDRLVLGVDGGYDVEAEAGDRFAWRPVRLSATAGTLERGDARPGLEAFWSYDPDEDRTDEAGYRAAWDVGAFRVEADQTFGPAGEAPGTHRYAVIWADVARVTLEGPELVPAGWLSLEPDPTAVRRFAVRLQDDVRDAGTRAELTYRTELVPLDEGGRERRGSRLEATLRLDERRVADGWLGGAVTGFADLALPDDAQPEAYLRRASLSGGLDAAGRVALQGTLGYRASYDLVEDRVRSGRLALESVSLVLRATRELYLGATLDDVWEIVDEDAVGDAAIDPRPTVFVTWDRCCWALYASWDTRSGEATITLGAPGSREGAQFGIEEGDGPTIPWGTDEEETP